MARVHREIPCRSQRRIATVVVVLLAGLAAGCVEHRLRAELSRADSTLLTSPGIHVVLCGTSGALADPRRAGPCTAVVAARRLFLVDVGPGAWKGADLAGLPLAHLQAVLLTSFLADDLSDLGEAMTRSWIAGRERPLRVYGPPGTASVVGDVVRMYARDVRMRGAHHDARNLDPEAAPAEAHEFAIDEQEGEVVVLDTDGLRIAAFSVGDVGGVPSVGYRFAYGGRSVVIAGHERQHPNAARAAAGADLLIHEAAAPAMIDRAIETMERLGRARLADFSREMQRWYASPVEVAELARAAGVRRVVLTRLYPPPTDALERFAFMRGVRDVFPDVVLGEDGMRFHLAPVAPRAAAVSAGAVADAAIEPPCE